jgi:hypothetical protein
MLLLINWDKKCGFLKSIKCLFEKLDRQISIKGGFKWNIKFRLIGSKKRQEVAKQSGKAHRTAEGDEK